MCSPKKILVIDDEEAVLIFFRKLIGHSYDLVTTMDPASAVNLAIRENPDLILCDMDMPEVNGAELSCRFFECKQTRSIPFAYLTSLVLPVDISQFHSGIVIRRAIAKTMPVDAMILAIERML